MMIGHPGKLRDKPVQKNRERKHLEGISERCEISEKDAVIPDFMKMLREVQCVTPLCR